MTIASGDYAVVEVEAGQSTTVARVHTTGEITGVGGIELALVDGAWPTWPLPASSPRPTAASGLSTPLQT
ncbi:hypothetical protein [Micromonospora sp. NPDC050276]|uniref:hypothetical protein n=1 Tax=Micromonospora sp. NPDC050276 TaxID=3364278 RepID=UPI0037948C35